MNKKKRPGSFEPGRSCYSFVIGSSMSGMDKSENITPYNKPC